MHYSDFPDNRGPGKAPKYPLRKLAIGETIFLPGATTHLVGKAARNKKPMRFRCKTIVKGGIKGTKVTRTE